MSLYGSRCCGRDRALISTQQIKCAGAALVLVTIHLDEGLALATHVAVMREGRFVRVDARASIDPLQYAITYRTLVGAAG